MHEMNSGAWRTGMRTGFALAIALLTLFGAAVESRAQHQAQSQANASQAGASHPDVALVSSASPVQLLPANTNRVTAICQMIGTIGTSTARIGDSSIGASRGTQLSSTIPAATFDVTGALYGFSSTGATVNCAEVVRQ